MNLAYRSQLATALKYGSRHIGRPLDGGYAHGFAWPSGLAPIAQPDAAARNGLPAADVIVMVDTEAEAAAASDVLTPGYHAKTWHPYAKNYDELLPQIGPHGPARQCKRLGSFLLTMIGGKRVLCFKSECHMHEDAMARPSGGPTLPIKDLLLQIIADAGAALFLTTGTAGGVYPGMPLGDVVISRAATFACKREFANAPYNGKTFQSPWSVPIKHLADAEQIMESFASHLADGKAPDAHCDCTPAALKGRAPAVHLDGDYDIPPFHPVLTVDYFEFGTSRNDLYKQGIAVEMDDACLGLACSELKTPPRWACVRNLSDPCINGGLPEQIQDRCAEHFYSHFGYWTSVNSALAAWAVVAAL